MSHSRRVGAILALSFATVAWMFGAVPSAQVSSNPYRAVYGWEKLPPGMKLGVVSGVYPDRDGKHMWVLSRCGGNNCAGSDQDPILKFDLNGNLVKSFGKGLFGWPHGFFVDHEGNVWVTDGAPAGEGRGERGAKLGKGHQVFKFSPEGRVLMTLGKAGLHGDGPDTFNGPSHAAVERNGDIWVTDGHHGGNNRLVQFTKDGKFKMQIGGGLKSATMEKGLFNDPHHIAFDSQGRIFVSDRGNNRIQIFDQEGKFIAIWTQFGRPSAAFIDANDTIYVVDGTSGGLTLGVGNPSGGISSNAGYERGIRIGSVRNGWVTAFIPELEVLAPGLNLPDREGQDMTGRGVAMEFLGVDAQGNIYAGEVQSQRMVKWIPINSDQTVTLDSECGPNAST